MWLQLSHQHRWGKVTHYIIAVIQNQGLTFGFLFNPFPFRHTKITFSLYGMTLECVLVSRDRMSSPFWIPPNSKFCYLWIACSFITNRLQFCLLSVFWIIWREYRNRSTFLQQMIFCIAGKVQQLFHKLALMLRWVVLFFTGILFLIRARVRYWFEVICW